MASDPQKKFPSDAVRRAYYRNRKKILSSIDICALCGGFVDKTLPAYHPMSAEIDHIIPVNKGGDASTIENLQLAHRKCNRNKSDKLPEVEKGSDINPESWLTWT